MHGSRNHSPTWASASKTSGSRCFFTFYCVEDPGERFGCDDFARLSIPCRNLQLSPFDTLPVSFPIANNLQDFFFSRCFVPFDSWPRRFLSKFPFLALKILHFVIFLLDTSFYHCLQSVIVRFQLSSDESPYCTIPIRS